MAHCSFFFLKSEKESISTEGTEKGCLLPFSVPSKQCAQPLPCFKAFYEWVSQSAGAQRAEPLPLP
jgi:hypothetical protein